MNSAAAYLEIACVRNYMVRILAVWRQYMVVVAGERVGEKHLSV